MENPEPNLRRKIRKLLDNPIIRKDTYKEEEAHHKSSNLWVFWSKKERQHRYQSPQLHPKRFERQAFVRILNPFLHKREFPQVRNFMRGGVSDR